MSTPPDRPANRFDRFAESASAFVSNGAFFTISVLVVVAWMPTILIFESIDTWQLVINTMTSVPEALRKHVERLRSSVQLERRMWLRDPNCRQQGAKYGASGTRTRDLSAASRTLSQLSYSPALVVA